MKKLFVLVLCLSCFVNSKAVSNKDSLEWDNPKAKTFVDIFVGTSVYSINTFQSPNMGFSLGATFHQFYVDFSLNGVSGKGEYLKFSSSQTYDSNKLSVGVFNIGWNLGVCSHFFIVPTIGYVWTNKIYQDPIGWETYYQESGKSYVNLGAIVKIIVDENLGLYFGMGNIEKFKFGISYCFSK